MTKASLFASAAIATLALSAAPAFAQGPFADVPADHWAYASVDKLQKKGILLGYPDGTYGGKRFMTRYEFAAAIARLTDQYDALFAGLNRPAGQELPTDLVRRADLNNYVTKDDLRAIQNLIAEFNTELEALGVDINALKTRLNALEARVAYIENELRRVRIGGEVNLYARGNYRTNRENNGFIDLDGFRVSPSPVSNGGTQSTILDDLRVLHDVDLSVRARISDTSSATAILNFGNYLDHLGGIASFTGARSDRNAVPGFGGQTVNQDQTVTVYRLSFDSGASLPVLGLTNFSVGRIPLQVTDYTLKLIDVNRYFYNSKTDLGDYPVDGVKATFKVGPVAVQGFAAKTDSIKYVSNQFGKLANDLPTGIYAGASFSPFTAGGPGLRGFNNFVPSDSFNGPVTGNRPVQSSIAPGRNGALAVDQLAGGRVSYLIPRVGTLGATFIGLAGSSPNPLGNNVTDFDQVYVYGADLDTKLGPVLVKANYTKSDTYDTVSRNDRTTTDNYAFDVQGRFDIRGIKIGGGYKEIGPLFGAPGAWETLGSYTNPTDIKGFNINAEYSFDRFTVFGSYKDYEGTGDLAGGLDEDDNITNVKARLFFPIRANNSIDLSFENTEYDVLTGASRRNAREQFYTLAYGYNFNASSSLRLAYQITNYNDDNSGFDTQNGDGGVATAQFTVRF